MTLPNATSRPLLDNRAKYADLIEQRGLYYFVRGRTPGELDELEKFILAALRGKLDNQRSTVSETGRISYEALLEANARQAEQIKDQSEDIARLSAPSAIEPQWVSVLDKLPEGFDDVLVAHPVYAKTSRDMFGVEIRSASTVRKWMSDARDTSMHGGYWRVLPKGPA